MKEQVTRPARILVIHEYYRLRGGEDQSVEIEIELLQNKGHIVDCWLPENLSLNGLSPVGKASLAWQSVWSRDSYKKLLLLVQTHGPDVVHFHNTLPIISPSAIHAAHDAGLPVVMTLHNYRLMCPVATYLRDGRVCEDCRTHSLARSVLHGCYRGSRVQTATVAMMLAAHRYLGTWDRCVDAYIALTEFMRSKVIEGGLPREKVHVRGNVVSSVATADTGMGEGAVFVGRLSAEKGVATLLHAAPMLSGTRLRIVGSGPMDALVSEAARNPGASIDWLGQLPQAQALEVVASSRVLIFPSICYETFGLSIVEAFACGVPVVASRLGAMAEIVTDGHDGYLVTPGDAPELADRVRLLMTDDALRERMGRAARATYEARYSTDRCYEKLMEIYTLAIESARARRTAA